MDSLFQDDRRGPRPIVGAVVAPVVDNVDFARKGTVKIRVPWGAQQELAAPVVAPGAGANRGLFSIPKKGDNVLVVFEDGDATRPYVIGGLWTGTHLAPIDEPSGADSQHVLRTQAGQEIRIDELADTVTILTKAGPTIECTPDQIRIEVPGGGGAKLLLNSDGSIELSSTQSIVLKAPTIALEAETSLKLTSEGEAELRGGPTCNLNGQTVRINS